MTKKLTYDEFEALGLQTEELKINGAEAEAEANKMGVKVVEKKDPVVKIPAHENLIKESVADIYINKTLQLLEHQEFFEQKIKEYVDKLVDVKVKDDNADLKTIEGRDIKVCIRARPMLEHEKAQNYFEIVHAQNQKFHFFGTRMNSLK